MPIDPGGDPWPGATYKGFSGGTAGSHEAPAAAPRPPRRRSRRLLLVASGVAAALALGLAFGFLARPKLAVAPAPAAAPPTQSADLPTPGAFQVPLVVSPPTAPPATPAQGKLETLPPEMAAASHPPKPAVASAAPAQAQESSAPSTAASQEAAAPAVETPRAGLDCTGARPGAEQMVCADPELADADRQLARAYRRALGAGIDPADLRQEQRDWTAIREDAARRSRQAVVQVYDQRIGELNRMADDAARGAPDGSPEP